MNYAEPFDSNKHDTKPLKLEPVFHEKIWGASELQPWFHAGGKQIGEVWLTGGIAVPPVLVKFIFTSARLSIQVHPDDQFAQLHEGSKGKDEMWHILRAGPDAAVAFGLRDRITREELRDAAASGEIEYMLNWMPVERGDTLHIRPGTIHAIGGGLALCEVQEVSDITYRLYDYGRPRELHVDKAVQVADLDIHPNKIVPIELNCGIKRLVASAHYVTDIIDSQHPVRLASDAARPIMLVVLEGSGCIGENHVRAGDGWLLPAGSPELQINPIEQPFGLLRITVP